MRYRFAGVLLLSIIIAAPSSVVRAAGSAGESLTDKIVTSFRAGNVPLDDALLLLAQQEKLPLGIEYIDERSLTQPLSIEASRTTVSSVLKLILSRAHGYKYSVQYGVIIISHTDLPSSNRNLLGYKLASFEAPRRSLDDLSRYLQISLAHELHPEVRGWAGDYIPARPVVLAGPLSYHNASIEQILCGVVSNETPAAWVITVTPARLQAKDSGELWHILPYTAPPTRYSALLRAALPKSAGAGSKSTPADTKGPQTR